jgi:predicted nucleic acid-binding protein
MTLIDTNVVVDILASDPVWREWSAASLARRIILGPTFINEVVYAELSARTNSETELRQGLANLEIELARTPEPALFIAGKTYRRYRTDASRDHNASSSRGKSTSCCRTRKT